MPIPSSNQLAGMRKAQVRTMSDKITVVTGTLGTDSYGDEILQNQNTQQNVACGFSFEEGKVLDQRSYTDVDYEATCRLPLTAQVGIKNLIRLTMLKGVAQDILFELVTYPVLGPSAQNLFLRRRTT